jgi:dTDP-4-dehydrorhamnose reductase
VEAELGENSEITELRAALYVRTATEHQQYSTDNHAPSVVINAAAYTAVDKAEQDGKSAFRLNAEAPGEMARACAKLDVPFVHISSDYVFNGSGSRPWLRSRLHHPRLIAKHLDVHLN